MSFYRKYCEREKPRLLRRGDVNLIFKESQPDTDVAPLRLKIRLLAPSQGFREKGIREEGGKMKKIVFKFY
jgi:hypothetical protein